MSCSTLSCLVVKKKRAWNCSALNYAFVKQCTFVELCLVKSGRLNNTKSSDGYAVSSGRPTTTETSDGYTVGTSGGRPSGTRSL